MVYVRRSEVKLLYKWNLDGCQQKQLKNFQNLFQSCLQKSIHCIYQLIWCWKNPYTLKTCRNGIPFLIFLSYQAMLNYFSDETIKSVTKLYVVLLNRRETETSILIVELTTSIILTKNGSSALHACNGITNLVLKKNVRLHGCSILSKFYLARFFHIKLVQIFKM